MLKEAETKEALGLLVLFFIVGDIQVGKKGPLSLPLAVLMTR